MFAARCTQFLNGYTMVHCREPVKRNGVLYSWQGHMFRDGPEHCDVDEFLLCYWLSCGLT